MNIKQIYLDLTPLFAHLDPSGVTMGHLDRLFGKQTVLVDGQDTTILRQRLVEEAAPVMTHVKGSQFLDHWSQGMSGWEIMGNPPPKNRGVDGKIIEPNGGIVHCMFDYWRVHDSPQNCKGWILYIELPAVELNKSSAVSRTLT